MNKLNFDTKQMLNFKYKYLNEIYYKHTSVYIKDVLSNIKLGMSVILSVYLITIKTLI